MLFKNFLLEQSVCYLRQAGITGESTQKFVRAPRRHTQQDSRMNQLSVAIFSHLGGGGSDFVWGGWPETVPLALAGWTFSVVLCHRLTSDRPGLMEFQQGSYRLSCSAPRILSKKTRVRPLSCS